MAERFAALAGERGVEGQHRRCVLTGRLDQRPVNLKSNDFKSGGPALTFAEQIAFATQSQILLCDAKTVLSLAHHRQTGPSGRA